jgi:hypothetical protein
LPDSFKNGQKTRLILGLEVSRVASIEIETQQKNQHFETIEICVFFSTVDIEVEIIITDM